MKNKKRNEKEKRDEKGRQNRRKNGAGEGEMGRKMEIGE